MVLTVRRPVAHVVYAVVGGMSGDCNLGGVLMMTRVAIGMRGSVKHSCWGCCSCGSGRVVGCVGMSVKVGKRVMRRVGPRGGSLKCDGWCGGDWLDSMTDDNGGCGGVDGRSGQRLWQRARRRHASRNNNHDWK